MLKKTFATLLISLLAFSSSNVFAFKWGVKTRITGYYTYAEGHAFINVESKENPDKCLDPTYLLLDGRTSNFKQLFSMVIAAQASGQTVTLNYDGCEGSYPKIVAIATPGVW